MDLWSIVKAVGASALNIALPGSGAAASAIINVVNEFLPGDKKLPRDATGSQIEAVIKELPPEQQIELMNKKFDVDITQIKESYETNRTMLTVDATSTHTTRPLIAKGSFQVVAFAVIVMVSTWAYAVITENNTMVKTVVEGWPFLLAVIGPLVTLLYAYFGILKQEQKNKLSASTGGQQQGALAGLISGLIGRGKK